MTATRIKVKGVTGFHGSTPAIVMQDMLRYDSGKIEAIWDYPDTKFPYRATFTAIVQLKEYTQERWASFGLTTSYLSHVGRYSAPGYTVQEWEDRGKGEADELPSGDQDQG